MPEPPISEADLDQMTQRALVYSEDVPGLTRDLLTQYVAYYMADVPRLVAEVRRLRALTREQE
jgi:hypothetical protein